MRDADDQENQGGNVTQGIEGQNHQIAGRDIIIHYVVDERPKRLDEHTPDELRFQRELSRHILKDAKNKIWNSWPVTLIKFSVPLYLFGTLVFFQFKWLSWFLISGMLCVALPIMLLLKVNETEFRLIHSKREIIDYVYQRLRDFGIDER